MYGKKFKVIESKKVCNEDWLYYINDQGQYRSIPAKWTNLCTPDPFVEISQGRSYFRYDELLSLSNLLLELKKSSD